MVTVKQKILIVEGNLDLADALNAYFTVQGYDVTTVHCGEDGVRACAETHPALIILDTLLADIHGYEVARRIRSSEQDTEIPILFMCEDAEIAGAPQNEEFRGDTHLPKPINVHDLRDHVVKTLLHTHQDIRTNPVTGLPEGPPVEDKLKGCLGCSHKAIMRISLNNLDAYRGRYGDTAADEVLHMIGFMVQDSVGTLGGQDDFLGHLTATVLVLVTQKELSDQFRDGILNRLQQSLEYFYPIQDRDRNALAGKRLNVGIKTLQPSDNIYPSLDLLMSSILSN